MVDQSPRMVLIDAGPDMIAALVDDLPNWVVSAEEIHPLPDSGKRVDRPPG